MHVAWLGLGSRGVAWRGVAWLGLAWLGLAWLSLAVHVAPVPIMCACAHVACVGMLIGSLVWARAVFDALGQAKQKAAEKEELHAVRRDLDAKMAAIASEALCKRGTLRIHSYYSQ